MSVISRTVASQDHAGADGVQFQELDQVLRDAQLRRTAEVGGWLRQYFESRRQTRLQRKTDLSTTAMTLGPSATG